MRESIMTQPFSPINPQHSVPYLIPFSSAKISMDIQNETSNEFTNCFWFCRIGLSSIVIDEVR